jgi:hypothetical protein
MPEDSGNYEMVLIGLEITGAALEEMTKLIPNMASSLREIVAQAKSLGATRDEIETALITSYVSEIFIVFIRLVLDEVFTD